MIEERALDMAESPPGGDPDKRTNLGRGLAALFGEDSEDYAALDQARATNTLPIEKLRPNPFQPRREFEPEALQALSESIAANGILMPILARRSPEHPDSFEIVAGERRWRAAQMARLHEVPVVIREFSDRQALEGAIVENVQREDLSAIEEAEGYRRLMDEFHHTQEVLAKATARAAVTSPTPCACSACPRRSRRWCCTASLAPVMAGPCWARRRPRPWPGKWSAAASTCAKPNNLFGSPILFGPEPNPRVAPAKLPRTRTPWPWRAT